MSKRVPLCDIPENFEPKSSAKCITRSFNFELITPMFGGEVESWHLNISNPVRVQSIKGQLRFWWRTMQNETDHKQLLANENRLWGGKTIDRENNEIRIRSKVSISVKNQSNFEVVELNQYPDNDRVIPQYVNFPIRAEFNKKEHLPMYFIKNIQFKLIVSYQEVQEETVINTIKLWTLFGGVGARTRRGAGSLYCKELLEEFTDINEIYLFLKKFKRNKESKYQSLFYLFFAGNGNKQIEPIDAWRSIINNYNSFRQARPLNQKNGRSYLPEPDAIRSLCGVEYSKEERLHPDGIWFPRAAFGLPILTKFTKSGKDPAGTFSLESSIGTGDRFPSPVILKVIKLVSGKVIPVCLVLCHKFPETIVLNWKDEKKEKPKSVGTFSGKELPNYYEGKIMNTNDPLNGRSIYHSLAEKLQLKEVK